MASPDDIPLSLAADFAALRKLRDDDASGALKESFGDGEDPREWKDGDGDEIVTVADGRVTKLSLWNCSSLVALPAAICELDALTTLELSGCESLAALPDAIGKLGALTYLGLKGCSSLVALPAVFGENSRRNSVRCSPNTSCTSIRSSPCGRSRLNTRALS